jgi:hypothetical protein
MDMQDKDFDKLFSSKLDGLEIEPSAKVWKDINEELSGNKPKKLIPFLSIAASIILLIAAGALFIPKKQAAIKSPVKDNVALVKKSVVDIFSTLKVKPATAPKTIMIATVKPIHAIHSTKTIVSVKKEKKDLKAESTPVPANTTQVLAVVEPPKNEIKQTPVIDNTNTVAAIEPDVQQSEQPAEAAAIVPPVEKTIEVAHVKKHKIRGVADLLNVAIAAVDKRKDKIIVFADNDGDGTVVTGVNLGIIKIKKEN